MFMCVCEFVSVQERENPGFILLAVCVWCRRTNVLAAHCTCSQLFTASVGRDVGCLWLCGLACWRIEPGVCLMCRVRVHR